jgi:hypothetical protein
MELETVKQKLKKIATLAQRGVGGEKENAKRLLQQWLDKYHLTLDDIAEKPPQESEQLYWFGFSSLAERDVLFACYCRALNTSDIHYYRGTKRRVAFRLGKLDYLELQSLWEHFRPLFRKEFKKQADRLGTAFCWKHNLSSSTPSENTSEREPLSQAEVNALVAMMRGLQDTNYVSTRRQLAS